VTLKEGQFDDVGVIVIGRNEGDRLIRCLQSLQRQARFLVYVDSGSTDGSIAAAEGYGASVVRLSTDMPFTAGRARNAGFQRLREIAPDVGFVQFIDGDCSLDPDWVRKAREFLLNDKSVGVVCGRRREQFPDASIFNWLCDQEWNTPVGETLSSGGDFLVRAPAFVQAGGFRGELMAGEEPELCHRIRASGHKVWRIDAPMTIHDANIVSFSQWWRRTRRTGYGYTQVFDLSAGSHSRLYSRELLRAIFWGGGLPLAILVGAIGYPPVMVASAAYAIPLVRAASRRDILDLSAWVYSGFIVIGKFAEFHGVVTYAVQRIMNTSQQAIEYKSI
jgi:glycosyltransferase involved in cell wall biosynthesis